MRHEYIFIKGLYLVIIGRSHFGGPFCEHSDGVRALIDGQFNVVQIWALVA